MPGGKIALPPNRLLKKSIRGLFQHAKQKAWFLLCFIFQTRSVFEKSAGSGFSRQPRRGLAQGCVKQKWRYVPIPHRRVMKNSFFITLLSTRSNVARVANAHYHHSVNYLAHTFLSHETPAAVIGGFLGDFVKGAIGNRFSPDIEQGILLHRKIDRYTDAHAAIAGSKRLVSPDRRRYAGIMVDVFYDHFLAKHWSRYAPIPLAEFTRRIYSILNQHRHSLPERLQCMLPRMANDDWLGSYRELRAIDAALNGIGRRFKRQNKLENAAEELEHHYAQFENHFFAFLPDLIQYVNDEKGLIQPLS